jgi:hypothetical protein
VVALGEVGDAASLSTDERIDLISWHGPTRPIAELLAWRHALHPVEEQFDFAAAAIDGLADMLVLPGLVDPVLAGHQGGADSHPPPGSPARRN